MTSSYKSRAWLVSGPKKASMEQFELSQVADDMAVLKVEACGICGSDKHIFLGHMPGFVFPTILGHEFIGTIVEMGKHANEKMCVFTGKLKVGDRVAVTPPLMPCGHCFYCCHMPHRPQLCNGDRGGFVFYGGTSIKYSPGLLGGFAEYVCLLPDSAIFQLPKEMPLKKAILVEPLANAIRAVGRAYNPGEASMGHGYGIGRSVMVLGAGPIGIMTIASLRYSGAGLIIVQELLESRLEMVKKFSADLYIDGKLPFEERLKLVQGATGGVGPDIVIEAAGIPVAFKEAIEFVRPGGKVIEVGHFTDTGSIDIHPDRICLRDIEIHGSFGYPQATFQDAISMLERTTLPVEDIVTHILPLDDMLKGMELLGSEGVGKVVLKP